MQRQRANYSKIETDEAFLVKGVVCFCHLGAGIYIWDIFFNLTTRHSVIKGLWRNNREKMSLSLNPTPKMAQVHLSTYLGFLPKSDVITLTLRSPLSFYTPLILLSFHL